MFSVCINGAASVFAALLLVYMMIRYPKRRAAVSDMKFRNLVQWVLLADVFALIASVSVGLSEPVTGMMGTSLITMLFGVSGFTCLAFMWYMDHMINGEGKTALCRLDELMAVFYFLVLLVNYFTGFGFYFDREGEMVRNPGFFLVFLLQLVVCIPCILLLYKNRAMGKVMIGSGAGFVAMFLLGATVELVLSGKVFITTALVSLSLVGMLFSIKASEKSISVDSKKLLELLDELEAAAGAGDSKKAGQLLEDIKTMPLSPSQREYVKKLSDHFKESR